MIVKNVFDPAMVPPMVGVNIKWDHPTREASVDAAHRMSAGFGITGLAANTPPALVTLHMSGQAIDMSITWAGTLSMANKDGSITTIDHAAHRHEPPAQSCWVDVWRQKFVGGNADKPHRSTTGH